MYMLLASALMLFTIVNYSDGSILDWIWPDRNVNVKNYRTDIENSESPSIPVIPFEFSKTNDQFIMDMSKVLGIRLYDLDFCQQRVILSLKTSCNSLTEEELVKLTVALMNCQHVIEKRSKIDCSLKVSLANCISELSNDMKSVYERILGRAKSVCLVIRQDQFRGMTEITVNKLMSQIELLKTTQTQLELTALNSIGEITDSKLKLLDKQNELLKLADTQRQSTEETLKEITKEKITLRNGQANLNLFFGKLKYNIEEGLNDLIEQNSETKKFTKDLLDDLIHINEISKRILQRLLQVDIKATQNEKINNKSFEWTTSKLKKTNEIVENISNKIDSVKSDFYSQIEKLEPFLGSGDILSHRCNIIFVHLLYLFFGMVCLVFINADFATRFIFINVFVCSSLCTLIGTINLNVIVLLEILIGLLIVNFINKINTDYHIFRKLFRCCKLTTTNDYSSGEILVPIHIKKNGIDLQRPRINNNDYKNEQQGITVSQSKSYTTLGETFPKRLQLIDFEHKIRHSTSSSDREFVQYDLGRCKAITRTGSRCQLMTPSSCTDFCRIHERSVEQ